MNLYEIVKDASKTSSRKKLSEYAKHESFIVRSMVALNRNCQGGTLNNLCVDKHEMVRCSAASNPNITILYVWALASKSDSVKACLARNENLNEFPLTKYFLQNNKSKYVRDAFEQGERIRKALHH